MIELKKKKGDIAVQIATLIGMVSIFVILLVGMNYISATIKYVKTQQIARKYILKMEVDGYLTQENIMKLKNECTKENIKNVDINNTTFSKVKFGEDLVLRLSYDQDIKEIEINGFNFTQKEKIKRTDITRSTTAKN